MFWGFAMFSGFGGYGLLFCRGLMLRSKVLGLRG